MKKIISALTVIMILSLLAVSALAYVSPGGTEYNNVYIRHGDNGKTDVTAVETGGTVVVKPSPSADFEGFEVFVRDKEGHLVAAVEGKDYEIISVTKEDGSEAVRGEDYEIKGGKVISKKGEKLIVVVKPKGKDVYITDFGEDYDPEDVVFDDPEHGKLSPKTGSVGMITIVMLIAVISGVCAVVTRKYAK